jgi:hypothetical protein
MKNEILKDRVLVIRDKLWPLTDLPKTNMAKIYYGEVGQSELTKDVWGKITSPFCWFWNLNCF